MNLVTPDRYMAVFPSPSSLRTSVPRVLAQVPRSPLQTPFWAHTTKRTMSTKTLLVGLVILVVRSARSTSSYFARECPAPYRTGYAGLAGNVNGFSLICFCRTSIALASWASRPAPADVGSLSITMSGSPPWPSMSHLPLFAVEGVVRLLDRTVVDGQLSVEDADQTAPGRHADDGAELSCLEVLEERLAVRPVVFVRDDGDLSGRRRARVAERLHAGAGCCTPPSSVRACR